MRTGRLREEFRMRRHFQAVNHRSVRREGDPLLLDLGHDRALVDLEADQVGERFFAQRPRSLLPRAEQVSTPAVVRTTRTWPTMFFAA